MQFNLTYHIMSSNLKLIQVPSFDLVIKDYANIGA